jgi:ribosome-binding factor A
MSQRKQRVAERIKQELSQIIHDQIKDPRVGFVTITRVDLNDDLKYAKVFYSVLGDDEQKKQAIEGLNSAKKFIRKLLGDSLEIRYTPDFSFKLDDSIEYNMHISKIFDKIAAERQQKEGESNDTKADS